MGSLFYVMPLVLIGIRGCALIGNFPSAWQLLVSILFKRNVVYANSRRVMQAMSFVAYYMVNSNSRGVGGETTA
ncbi:uncharacterized protein HD556DRAFT_742332 [Suillus plorans]|uniref:Uncharacterized protein n=1 Tax=Suillus plorans TaxID=116603 RepID=A0A9P7AKD3_9AGAM|nr:uncharacterized protein HD556DRAFT_742332 [Suillus plorans]KAG1790210.1 hypothetical protein HD556DRAFT_742332 [Suillus plorans]